MKPLTPCDDEHAESLEQLILCREIELYRKLLSQSRELLRLQKKLDKLTN